MGLQGIIASQWKRTPKKQNGIMIEKPSVYFWLQMILYWWNESMEDHIQMGK